MGTRQVRSVIDADSHVMEPAEVWNYLPGEYEARKPFIIGGEDKPFLQGMNSFWYIDGKTYPQPVGRGVSIYATPVTQARATRKPWGLGSQTLLDVPARLADLDRAGFDLQVNFPTLFLEPLTEDAPFEAALIRSYNYFEAETRNGRPLPAARASDYLRDCAVYFTTEAEERNLPYVLQWVGDERIMISGDMPHSEARDEAVEEIEERTDLTTAQKQRLLHDNAARFYSL